jgi:hypothetical protein
MSPETSVNFYQTTRRNVPEDSHLHTRRFENLKSHHLTPHLPEIPQSRGKEMYVLQAMCYTGIYKIAKQI